jgi:hypothetical protein
MKLNEFTLAKEAIKSDVIKLINKYDIKQKFLKYLTYNILTSLDVDLIVKYFDLFDYINSIYKNSINDYSIKRALEDPEDELQEMKYIPSIFKAALIREKMKVLHPIYHFFWFEEGYYEKGDKSNENFMKQMKPLIKEFSEKYPESLYTL